MIWNALRIGARIGAELAQKRAAKGRLRQFTPPASLEGVVELAQITVPKPGIGAELAHELARTIFPTRTKKEIQMSGFVSFMIDFQKYEFVGREPYLTRDGRSIEMLRFASSCPKCGATFEIKLTECPNVRGITRRCDDCKAPRRKVRKPPRA